MDNRMENIDRFFNEHLVNFEQVPPDANWEKISQRLGHKPRKRAAILILRIAAGMALLLSTGIGVIVLTKPDSKPGNSAISANQHNEMNSIPRETNPASVQPETPGHNNSIHNSNRLAPGKQNPSGKNFATGNSGEPEKIMAEASPEEYYRADQAKHVEIEPSDVNPMTALSGIHPGQLPQIDIGTEIRFNRARLSTQAVAIALPDAYAEVYIPEDVVAKKPGRWTIGSEVAPLYSYRTISSDELQSVTMDELNDKENGLLAYSGGVRVAFSTGKRLSVQSGVYYSRYGQQTNNIETVAVNYISSLQGKLESKTYVSISNSTGVISKTNSGADKISMVAPGNYDGASYSNRYDAFPEVSGVNPDGSNTGESDFTLTQYFDYLEVPLVVRYKIIDRKMDFNLSGGVITNFLFSNRVNITRNGDTEFFGETSDINHINYQGSVGMGIEYPVTKGFSFTVEPRFRYYINPIDKTAEINVHPYSFGFYAGFNYLF
ncbi:MAG: outer membrane beta-barrel protein [Bacteroidales bacterium]